MSATSPIVGGPLAVAEPRSEQAVHRSQAVTLVTGDVVLVDRGAGSASAIVTKTRPGVAYVIHNRNGKLLVVPSDAEAAIRSGTVDETLFDVAYLADNGYADADRSGLPLIAGYTKSAQKLDAKTVRGKAANLPGTRMSHTLDSIGAQAVEVDKGKAGQLWAAVAAGSSGVQRLSLDRKVNATLAESIPQVKAPQAWAAGYNGAGVKVAVLDTGADASHPDLGGRIATAASFVPSEQDNLDRHGHGTHVAATVAGTGAASGGQRKGVAPGAQLAIGKVLGGNGSGQESWIISGMQWAATTAQAKVINLSLGSGPTDGTDPMSQAVDSLTAQTGALFVIAAGNSGPKSRTIGAPGAATSALTVAAVDKVDAVASFSSRGPRTDGAMKPEVSAPGVAIVAARAAGTAMGSPVDQNYTSANGTSMATPHVAGQAAILAQRNPTWTAAQLKAGIVGSADDLGKPANAQGSGRINAQRAIAETVLANPAAVGFGNVDPSNTANQTRTITYNNTGAAAVTLSFSARLTDDAGVAAPAGTLSLSHTGFSVPAGGSATLTLTVNPNNLVTNVGYSGVVTASGAGAAGTVVTPITMTRTALRDVTFKVIGFDGQPMHSSCGVLGRPCLTGTLVPLDQDGAAAAVWSDIAPNASTVRVPVGTYSADLIGRAGVDPQLDLTTVSMIQPQIEITQNTDVVFDLRQLKKITVQTPLPSQRIGQDLFFKRTPVSGTARAAHVWPHEGVVSYTNPTPSVTKGSLDHQYQVTQMRAHLDITVGSTSWHPRYYSYSEVGGAGVLKAFTGSQQRTVVFGGTGDPAFFSGTSVQGKVVLVGLNTHGGIRPVVDRAVAAGAAGVIAYDTSSFTYPVSDDGGSLIPVTYLRKSDGISLRDALPGGSATATVAGYPTNTIAYHLAYDTIPANPAFTVQHNQLVSVSGAYHSAKPNSTVGTVDTLRRNISSPMLSITPGMMAWTPANRIDYYGPANPALLWERIVNIEPTTSTAMWTTNTVFNNPGASKQETWNQQPVRLGQPSWSLDIEGKGSYHFLSRQGNTFYPVPQLVDGHGSEHGGQPQLPNGTKVEIGLKRDGQPVTGRLQDEMTVYDVPAASANYELSLKYRPNGTTPGAYRVETTYGFTSQQAVQEQSSAFFMCGRDRYVANPDPNPCEVQKIDTLDYTMYVDLDNSMPVGVPRLAVFTLRPLGGTSRTAQTMQGWISYDEGATWQPQSLTRHSDLAFRTILSNATAGSVSLKLEVTDSAGGTVTETLYNVHQVK
ncbi:S8 family peptidase [Actinokineospora alba]|nr:S8 family serine peptidase [Actinokineospora alba]